MNKLTSSSALSLSIGIGIGRDIEASSIGGEACVEPVEPVEELEELEELRKWVRRSCMALRPGGNKVRYESDRVAASFVDRVVGVSVEGLGLGALGALGAVSSCRIGSWPHLMDTCFNQEPKSLLRLFSTMLINVGSDRSRML